MNRYKMRRYLNEVLDLFSLTFPFIICIVILFLSIFSYKNYSKIQEDTRTIVNDVEKLKTRVDTIKNGRALIEDEIDEINQLFSVLIPDSEDFFSIIYALEKISEESGFIIDNYSISLGESQEKLNINVDGSGDTDTFIKFLKTYPFSGGRFVTSEKINFTNSKSVMTTVSLTFYSKKVVVGDQAISRLTIEDIDFVRKIKEKVKIELKKNEETTSNEDYATKLNPF